MVSRSSRNWPTFRNARIKWTWNSRKRRVFKNLNVYIVVFVIGLRISPQEFKGKLTFLFLVIYILYVESCWPITRTEIQSCHCKQKLRCGTNPLTLWDWRVTSSEISKQDSWRQMNLFYFEINFYNCVFHSTREEWRGMEVSQIEFIFLVACQNYSAIAASPPISLVAMPLAFADAE